MVDKSLKNTVSIHLINNIECIAKVVGMESPAQNEVLLGMKAVILLIQMGGEEATITKECNVPYQSDKDLQAHSVVLRLNNRRDY